MRVEVQEQTGPLPAQHFEYQDRIDKNRWVRVGPQGEEILLRVPLIRGRFLALRSGGAHRRLDFRRGSRSGRGVWLLLESPSTPRR
jgi:hypothetical protein